jgi:hypothetical protein
MTDRIVKCLACEKILVQTEGEYPLTNSVIVHVSRSSMNRYVYYCEECFRSVAPPNLIDALEWEGENNPKDYMCDTLHFDDCKKLWHTNTEFHHKVRSLYCGTCGHSIARTNRECELFLTMSANPDFLCPGCKKVRMYITWDKI